MNQHHSSTNHDLSLENWFRRLSEAKRRLANVFAADHLISDIEELTQRLQAGKRMIAVFGAFSAGKSSLINALLGDAVLVVSPNPTTASVTEIQGPNEATALSQMPLQETTAWVHMKTLEAVEQDVRQVAAALHKPVNTLDEGLQLAKTLKPLDVSSTVRRHLLYLKAVAAGYSEVRDKLGTTLQLSWEEARQFTAEERFACFVQRVQLQTPSSFLKEGLSLVDTPGVDSVHHRHTDVAFDYMRKADAIVLVIYYTHAFSRADKDFLLQLSGVQDVVGKDKLFVVINAVDLATSQEERLAVRRRVEQELRQFGLRQPRIHEVSSQLAFAAKQMAAGSRTGALEGLVRQRLGLTPEQPLPSADDISGYAGLESFEIALQTFVDEQSVQLLEDAARRLWSAVRDWVGLRLARLEGDATASEDARKERRSRQEDVLQRLRTIAEGASVNDWQNASMSMAGVDSQVHELVFHIGERIRFRLPELVREAFHPGRFIQASRAKQSLREAAEELAGWLVRQWQVETRTLALRSAAFAHQTTLRFASTWQAEFEAVLLEDVFTPPTLSLEQFQDRVVERLPEVPMLDWTVLERAFSHFSSAKQFFEGGGQKALIEACSDLIGPWTASTQSTVEETIIGQVTSMMIETLRSWATVCARTASDGLEQSDATLATELDTLQTVHSWLQGEV